MFDEVKLDPTVKTSFYHNLADQAKHLTAGESSLIANLSNTSALLNMQLEDINWVGFYLWDESKAELVLGPFQGKPACIRIGFGKGVCGTAAEQRKTIVVDDVMKFEGHIACDAASRSEVVVPLLKEGKLVGVLDIDSPTPGRFDKEDGAGLELVAAALLENVS
ncbi:GAF domain-containing protein [Alicyclobacillus sp. SO9]|uniref:GAF domain-containing protein n=1 Tax=Alicyclobacillus sp. SO9 TaxID=2665646 RepID=UPI0018E73958|nr:GAF domain-containing protein [Alicyclobacillus sp. SO9]QQE80364.1 GAF domain-containing protein [Alicyclobacillus sp. SO9]